MISLTACTALYILLITVIIPFTLGNITEHDQFIENSMMLIMMAGASVSSVCAMYAVEYNSDKSRRFVSRKRRCVSDIFSELGPIYTRRSYRMTENEFWKLYSLIAPYYPKKKNRKRKRGNGYGNSGSNPESIPNKKD